MKLGSFVTYAVDLRISVVGSTLALARTYDSSAAVDGILGVGWTSNFETHLFYEIYLFSAPSTYQRQATILMPNGLRLRFTENADGVTYTPPTGRYDTLVKNTDGTFDLTLEHSRTTYHFGSDGRVLFTADEFGNSVNFNYDGSNRLIQIADAAGSGRYFNFYYGSDGRISNVHDSAGRQVQYTYDTSGLLKTVTDAAGRTSNYGYTQTNIGSLLSQVTDAYGRVVTTVTYNSAAQVATLMSEGESYTLNYGVGGVNRTQKQGPGTDNRWLFTYNAVGQVVDRTRVYGSLNTWGPNIHSDLNADGSVQQETDEVGVKTYYTYDSQGRTTSVTRDYQGPLAVQYVNTYDPAFPNKITSVTPKNPSTGSANTDWQAWQYDYYQAGAPAPGALYHVHRIRSDSTRETLATYVYDAHGRVTRVTSATGGVTDYAYDGIGNLATVTGPANNDAGTRPITGYGYDAVGRVTTVTDPLGHVTTYAYDPVGRITSMTLPKPSVTSSLTFTTSYSYDNYDSVTGLTFTNVTDPNGRVTKQGYDQWGRLVRSVDPANNTTVYAYTQSVMTSVQDADGYVTEYTYDDLTRNLKKILYPDGAADFYSYFDDGTLKGWQPRSGTVWYTYDDLKRVIKEYRGGPYTSYTYVGQKLTQVYESLGGPSQTWTYGYDPSYRVTSDTQDARGTITYTYDAGDAVGSYSVQGGPSATYTRYPDGSLNTISWTPAAGQFKYRYTLPGQYQQITFPNGQSRNFAYDDQGRLLQLSNLASGSVNLATYGYGYDLNYTTGQNTMLGQRVSMTATVPNQGLNNHLFKYEYDPLYQLVKATYPNVVPFNGEVDSWTYDAIGNRLTNTVNGITQTYTYKKIGANTNNYQTLLGDGTNTYVYYYNLPRPDWITTPSGNLNFTWDFKNRITALSGTATASYAYDYQGRRLTKTVGAATNAYLYDGLNLIQEQGTTAADYLFGLGIDEPLAMSRGGQTYYYLTDALGSAAAVTNSSGAVQNSYLYDAWGQVKSQTGSLLNPFGYTAREFGESGQLFYRARHYQPSTGRLLSEDDPRQSEPNKYAYVRNSPVMLTDPTGLAVKQCFRPLRWPLKPLIALLPLLPPVPTNTLCPMHEYLYNTDLHRSKSYDPHEDRQETGNGICWTLPEPMGTCAWNHFEQAAGPRENYNFLSHNCQDAVENAIKVCTPCTPPTPRIGPERCSGINCFDSK